MPSRPGSTAIGRVICTSPPPLAAISPAAVGGTHLPSPAVAADQFVVAPPAGQWITTDVSPENRKPVFRQSPRHGSPDAGGRSRDDRAAGHSAKVWQTSGYTGRMAGVAFVAHCLLNQNAKVYGGARCPGIY